MPEVLLTISGLSAGGSERVISLLANAWVARGRNVTLATWSDPSDDHYQLDPGVTRKGLANPRPSRGVGDAIRNNVKRIRTLRSAFRERPGRTVVAFGDTMNVLCVIASLGTGVRVVACIRNDPRQLDIGRPRSLARRLVYPRASRVVVQTVSVERWAKEFIPEASVVTIPNPVRQPDCERSASGDRAQRRRVLAVGRLVEQKGFDLLVRAFASLADKHLDWDLTILGEGAQRSELESLVAQLGLTSRVALPGVVDEPGEHMAMSDLFVLSSRYEGFPNALLEAMACGLAVISTDCPSGPGEIINEGRDGMLVPNGDVAALADAMRTLMADPEKRGALGDQARTVLDRYSTDAIVARWDALVDEVASR